MRTPRHSTADSLALLSTIAIVSFVAAILFFARAILIPIALATLLTFMLTPVVSRLERFVGRVAAVLVIVTMIFAGTGVMGWVLTQQIIDLATRLPDYKENIVTKLHAIRLPHDRRLIELTRTVEEVRKELPGTAAAPALPRGEPPAAQPVQIVESPGVTLLQNVAAWVVGPLGTGALVLLLVVCMLLQREDLRRRFIRLVGQGHISAATRALDDAGQRVSRFLLMQFAINVAYGAAIAIGLFFIGVPNAVLWGGITAVLRFVPYVGIWVAAFFPIVLSLAVSPGWLMPVLTMALFAAVELVSFNLMEPILFGSSTGVSAIALIVAAVCWTWLWGPLGLALATPLTVCLVVLGRHVPQFAFLSVLLSDEEPLTPAEDFYQRLLTPGDQDEMELVESCLKTATLAELYDGVMIPVLTAAATDLRLEALDREQLARVEHGLRDVIEELSLRLPSAFENEDGTASGVMPLPRCNVICLAARAERDLLAGAMLAHLLQQHGCEAEVINGRIAAGELPDAAERSRTQAVCVSVVAPSTLLHARHLCRRVRAQLPDVTILAGLWGFDDSTEGSKGLTEAGADYVVTSFADALLRIAEAARTVSNEPQRPIAALARR